MLIDLWEKEDRENYKKYLVTDQYASSTKFDARTQLLASGDHPQTYWEWIADHYNFDSPRTILDIGCGNGKFWSFAQGKLQDYHSVIMADISDGMLASAKTEIANSPKKEQFLFKLEDIESLKFLDHSFDLVMAHLLLHHFEDPQPAIHEIKRVLKPGGTAGITAFPKDTLKSLFDLINKHLIDDVYTNCAVVVIDEEYEKLLKEHFSCVTCYPYTSRIKVSSKLAFDFIQSLDLAEKITLPKDFYEKILEELQQQAFFETQFSLTLFLVS